MTFEFRLKKKEGASLGNIWSKNALGRQNKLEKVQCIRYLKDSIAGAK